MCVKMKKASFAHHDLMMTAADPTHTVPTPHTDPSVRVITGGGRFKKWHPEVINENETKQQAM